MRPYTVDEAHLFFGRERLVTAVVRRLQRSRFVAITGNSGAGKSSLVRAGVMPGLFSGSMMKASWRVAILRPGATPRLNLSQALSAPEALGGENPSAMVETLRYSSLGLVQAVHEANLPAGTRLLLIVDQFEELFRYTLSGDPDESAAFVKLLLEAASSDVPIYVLITLRTDFLADCERFRGLPEAIGESLVLVPRMTRDEARQAVEGPIALEGVEIEPQLVDRLLNEVGSERDSLCLLQHALRRTWDRWLSDGSGPLAIRHYLDVGGIEHSLERALEVLYESLPEPSKEIARVVFQRLVAYEAGRFTRAPATLIELVNVAGAPQRDVISVFDTFRHPNNAFLLPEISVPLQDQTVIDIAHEAIIRQWPRLRRWNEQERSSAEFYGRLATSAELFQQGKAGYYRDPELAMALEWRERNRPTPAWARRYNPEFEAAMSFLEFSRMQRDAELRAAARRAKMERWIILGALLAFIILFAYVLLVRR
jgi:hypothetical protein